MGGGVQPARARGQRVRGRHRAPRGGQVPRAPVGVGELGEAEHTEAFLDLLDGKDIADAWTTSDDVEASKPAPDLVSVAMEKVGGTRAVMIGDSVWDAISARDVGVPTIAVRTGGFSTQELRDAGAEWVFDSLEELRDDIEKTPLGGGR